MSHESFPDSLREARALASQGQWPEVRELLRADAAAGSPALVEGLVLLAQAELRLGEPHAARACLHRAIPILTAACDRPLLRTAVNLLGAVDFELGDLDRARDAFARALELADVDGDDLLMARATNNLGLIENIRRHHEEALGLYRLAIPAYQRVGSARGLAETLHNLAITFRDLGRLDEAEDHEQRAIAFAREAENPRLTAMARAGRAELRLLEGEPRVAEAGAELAAREYASIPDPVGEADALRLVGSARLACGAPKAALEVLDRAVALAHRHRSALIEAESRQARARARAVVGEASRARRDADAALAIYERLGATAERDALQAWSLALGDGPTASGV